MLGTSTVEQFAGALRGRLIRPDAPDYDAARSVYNAMIGRRPALIARCVDVADVIAAVTFAREHELPLAVRGGGHSGPGLGVCDDGLVVDLCLMKGVRVDPASRTVRVEGGCVWGDVDHATHAFGLATPSGFISTTGVGGLTLGGGIGYLSRHYGLTIDNLIGLDVVLADGRFVTVNAGENADLFWAVRGGGGNFGVVTSFEYRLHPVDKVLAGPMLWPMERAPELLKLWRDFILEAPEDINGWFAFMTVPPAHPFPEAFFLQPMCAISWCYSGPLEQAEQRFAPVRAFGAPAIDFTGTVPFPALQSLFDPFFPPGLQWYWKADFFKDLSDEAIALHVEHGAKLPTAQSTMHLYPINGAVHRVGRNDTAFSFRDANFAEVIVGVDPNPANVQRMTAWAREYWQALHPYSAGGAYVNMIMDEGQAQVRAAYRDNYDRLLAIKNKYDPKNLFRINQNIQPAS
ncbi:MAG: FAD-binding oxidoreductase [Candidatus Binatia bacterium]|jgi:FAD/FMN-containing dehydrogenase